MILSPNQAIKEGWIKIPSNVQDIDKYIQQNGIDVPIDKLFKLNKNDYSILSEKHRTYKGLFEIKPNAKYAEMINDELVTINDCFKVDDDTVYDWCSNFELVLPENVCALIIIRS